MDEQQENAALVTMLGLQESTLDIQFLSRLRRAAAIAAKDGAAFDAGLTIAELAPDAAQRIASDLPCREEPVSSYVTDVEVRVSLFKTFKENMAMKEMRIDQDKISTIAAVFMVVPLEPLRRFLDIYDSPAPYAMRSILTEAWPDVLPLFLSHGGRDKASQTGSASTTAPTTTPTSQRRQARTNSSPLSSGGRSSGTRNRTAVRVAKERDGHSCLFMGTPHPEAAHVFPFSAAKKPVRRARLGTLLRLFWPAHAAGWEQLYSDLEVTESPHNLLCLNHQLHHWWGAAFFALKPLRQSADGCALDVQFHWLRPLQFGDITTPESDAAFAASVRQPGWGPSLAHRRSGLPLQTGQVFTLRARVPSELPSFGLLELQWHLLRIAAMSGGAEAIEAQAENRRRKDQMQTLARHCETDDDGSWDVEYDDDDDIDDDDIDDDDDLGQEEVKDMHGEQVAAIEAWLGGTDAPVPDSNTS